MTRYYLDYAASAPLLPEAKQAMALAMDQLGNPSSQHWEGRQRKALIDKARASIVDRLGCQFGELVFTSGATESAQLGIVGAALAASGGKRDRVLMSAVEHHSVLAQATLLRKIGFGTEFIPVDRFGRADMGALEKAMGDDVLMVCLMHANNELGTWQPVGQASAIAHRHGALFFVDCAQTVGHFDPHHGPWSLKNLGADLASFSAHKWGGPTGIGALYVKSGTEIKPVLQGGGQERELRAGTESVLLMAGMEAGLEAFLSLGKGEYHQLAYRLDPLLFVKSVPEIKDRVETILHVRLPGVMAESMVIRLDQAGVAIGSGAACSSGSIEPSHVLEACGYSIKESKEGLRLSVGPGVTDEVAKKSAAIINEVASAMVKHGHGR